MSKLRLVKFLSVAVISGSIVFLFQNFTYPLYGWKYNQRPVALTMGFAPQKDFAYVAYYEKEVFSIYRVNLTNGQRSVVTQYSLLPGGPQKGSGPKNMFDLSQSEVLEELPLSNQGNSNPEDIPRSLHVNPHTGDIYVFSVDQSGSKKYAHFTKVDPKTGNRQQVNLKNVPDQLETNLKAPQINFFQDGKTAIVRINLSRQRAVSGPNDWQYPFSPYVSDGACFHKLDLETGKFSLLQDSCKEEDFPEMEASDDNVYFGQPTLAENDKQILFFNSAGILVVDIASNKRSILEYRGADYSWTKSYYEYMPWYGEMSFKVVSVFKRGSSVYDLVILNRIWGKDSRPKEYVFDVVRVDVSKRSMEHIKKLAKIPLKMRSYVDDTNHLYFSLNSGKIIFGTNWSDFTVYDLEKDNSVQIYK